MPKFQVQFAAAGGKRGVRTVDAPSEKAAIARLEAAGQTPIVIRVAGAERRKARSGKSNGRTHRVGGSRVIRRALLDFTHQMAAVSESGIPIVAGMRAIGEQTDHPKLKAAIGRIAARIEGGRSLADALDTEPDIFPPIYVRTLAAGEAAGKVSEVFAALARYQEQEAETRSQIKSAMMYPLLVVGALIIAIIIMLVVVVPQFAQMFDQFEGQLPLPTRVLLATSAAVTQHALLVVLGLGVLIYGLRTLLTYDFVRQWLDKRLLRIPVFGNIFLGVYMTRLIELLDLLTRAALPITQALRVTADSMQNKALAQDVRGMLRSVEGGSSLTEAFNRTRWLTPLVKRMLAIGEQAGRTDQIFEYLTRYYGRQTRRSIKVLSTLIEPVMVASLAGVVLFFALSIFLPMWKLLKLVGTA